MCFVRKAMTYEEQNLVITQENNAIYFTTTTNILPKQELKVNRIIIHMLIALFLIYCLTLLINSILFTFRLGIALRTHIILICRCWNLEKYTTGRVTNVRRSLLLPKNCKIIWTFMMRRKTKIQDRGKNQRVRDVWWRNTRRKQWSVTCAAKYFSSTVTLCLRITSWRNTTSAKALSRITSL